LNGSKRNLRKHNLGQILITIASGVILLFQTRVLHAQYGPLYESMGTANGYFYTEDSSEIAEDFHLFKPLGRWCRGDCPWSYVQRDSTHSLEDDANWACVDKWVEPALDDSLKPILLLAYAPFWAADSCQFDSTRSDSTWWAPAPARSYVDEWSNFCRAAAERYSVLGVHHYEIWNEPNSFAFFRRHGGSMSYPEVLVSAVDAIRHVDPEAFILSGGLSPTMESYAHPWDTAYGNLIPEEWLDSLYQYGTDTLDIRDYFDALSYHPYAIHDSTRGPLDTYDNPCQYGRLYSDGNCRDSKFLFTEDVHRKLSEYGDGSKKIWATEIGYSTAPGDVAESNEDEERIQAEWVDQYLSKWFTWDFAGPVLWFSGRDLVYDSDPDDIVASHHGLLRDDFSRKPAYDRWSMWASDAHLLHVGTGREGSLYFETLAEAFAHVELFSDLLDHWKVLVYDSPVPHELSAYSFNDSHIGSLSLEGVIGSPEQNEPALSKHVDIFPTGHIYAPAGMQLRVSGLCFSEGMWDNDRYLITSIDDLQIENCQFSSNHCGAGLIDSHTSLEIENCLFSNNHGVATVRYLGSMISALGELRLSSSSFHANWSPFANPLHFDLALDASHSSSIRNSIFSGSPSEFVGCTPKIRSFDGPLPDALEISYCATDQNLWARGVDAFVSRPSNHIFTPENQSSMIAYVDPSNDDLRLRHDSHCLDVGDPGLQDFDLTRSDIGWMPRYEVQDISGHWCDPLPIGFYQLSGNLTLSTPIPAGCVIRGGEGYHLEIRSPAAGGRLQVGALDGPRTAFVSRDHPSHASLATLHFRSTSLGIVGLALDGVLFNYPPRRGSDANLVFDAWNFDAELNPFDRERVSFQNYLEVPIGSGETGVYHGALRFLHCRGLLRGFDFGNTELKNGPQKLSLYQSQMQVQDCRFMWTGVEERSWPYITAYGPQTGGEVLLLSNTFETPAEDGAIPMLDFTEALLSMRRNHLVDCQTTPLLQTHSTVKMAHEARNDFRFSQDVLNSSPLIRMEAGSLDLFCGRNNFVLSELHFNPPFVTWEATHGDSIPDLAPWRENYWGVRCDSPLGEDFVNNGLIPFWAFAEDNLVHCLESTDPPNPACPFDTDDPSELLVRARDAETSEDFALAQSLYRSLLLEHPRSRQANEATLRLKALGFNKVFGEGAAEALHSDLLEVASISELAKAHAQSVLQLCAAHCIQARWLDRAAAHEALQALYALELDRINLDCIARALLEIESYPAVGAMMSSHPEAALGQRLERSAALQDLFEYRRDESSLSDQQAQVSSFEIQSIYPNPFNPRTTIEITSSVEGLASLMVYNLLGQRVAVLHQGLLTMGRHEFVFDGSKLASGVYFTVARQAKTVRVEKMLLLK
jgi:polysaccharide biosynthesis protein PslG